MRAKLFFRSVKRYIPKSRLLEVGPGLRSYSENMCGIKNSLLGVIYPKTEKEVQKVLEAASRYHIPIYPVSSGKNWGLGARIPSQKNSVILDLKNLNRIISFDKKTGVIEIQSGVTQQKIADYLRQKKSRFVLNVTGSAKDSSVVGNALERGVAHFGGRVSEVLAMQMVLGTGEKLRVGGGSVPHSSTHSSYGNGLGPDLRGLFFQSNFSVVTSCAIRLQPIRECLGSISFEPKSNTSLTEFIDLLSKALFEGLIPSNLHISNQARRLSVVTPLYARKHSLTFEEAEHQVRKSLKTQWSANASYSGSTKVVQAIFEELKLRYSKKIKINLLLSRDFERAAKTSKVLSSVQGTFFHSSGVPSSDSILSLGFESRQLISGNPVNSDIGTLFLTPVLLFQPHSVQRALNVVARNFKRYGFTPYITFNLLEDLNLEAVINLVFRKSDKAQTTKAHRCIKKTFRELCAKKIYPQRLSVFQARYFFDFDPTHKKIAERVGSLFDPNGIISPGRYSLKKQRRLR